MKLRTIAKAPSCSKTLAIGFFKKKKETATDDAIKNLLTKLVVRIGSHENSQFVCPIIVVTKS